MTAFSQGLLSHAHSPTHAANVLRCRPWLTPYWLPVIQISLTGSVWTTIAVSVERYFTVCLSKRYNTVQHLFYTLPILAFSFVFNIPGSDEDDDE